MFMNSLIYTSFHSPDLQSFFKEDPLIGPRRAQLEARRDRLALACTALSRIKVRGPSASSSPPVLSQSSAGARPFSGHMSRVTVTVAIGLSGIGLVVTDDDIANRIVVKDLRKMPGGAVNPSELAGIRVGDEVEMINGEAPATLQDAVNTLKTSRDSVTITVLRR